jgi:hypothetical protein
VLGPEGVKTAVLTRLHHMMPVALGVRRDITGATVHELPDVRHYFPTSEVSASSDMYPLITVTAEGTNGELSNKRARIGAVVEEFEFEYTVLIRLSALVESQAGGPAARLQVERLSLAAREALLGATELDVPGRDEAEVQFERWAEEYEVNGDLERGIWEAQSILAVPIATTEYLDTSPYRDARQAILESWDVEQVPASTGIPPTAT